MTSAIPVIGFGATAAVRINLSRLIESRLLIQSNSGGGKSTAIRYLLEQTAGDVQHIVLDREGEFATLRERLSYLVVGRDGDVAADVRTAKLLARKVMELELSVVIDLSEMSLAQQREYVAAFVGALNHLPRPLWHDCLVVIDEAHLFAPEAGKGASVATEAIAMLLSTGRKRGYCGVLATQRLSKLSKDVAAECLNKLIGRTSNEDLRRAADELDQAKGTARELRSLEPGTFWAYGPAIAAEPVLVRTGTVVTAPPVRGAARAPTAPPAGKIKAALAELADLPKQADDEARTVEGLRRENAELTRRIRTLEKGGAERIVEKPVADQAAIERAVSAERRVVAGDLRNLRAQLGRIMGQVAPIADLMDSAIASLDVHMERTAKPGALLAPTEHRSNPSSSAISQSGASARTKIAPAGMQGETAGRGRPLATSRGTLPSGERVTLTAIAQYPDGAARDQLSVLTGYKRSSRDTYINRLSSRGYVEARDGVVLATEDGIAALGADFEPLPTGEALQAYWLERLPAGERAILEILIGAGGNPVHRDALSEATGYKRSSRDTYIQRLASRKLAVPMGGGHVAASSNLFTKE